MESGGGKIKIKKQTQSRKPYTRPLSKSLFSRVSDSVKSLLTPITPHWLTKKDSSPSGGNSSVKRSEATTSKTQQTFSPYVTPPETPDNFVVQPQPSNGQSTSSSNNGPLFSHQQSVSKAATGKNSLDSPFTSSEAVLKLWSNTTLSSPQSAMTSTSLPKFNSYLQSPNPINTQQSPSKLPRKISYQKEKVQYGGAMADIKTTSYASPYRIPHVRKVHVKASSSKYSLTPEASSDTSSSENVNSSMSSTAKKILKTLEKMSTPLHDAKKIPVPKHHLSYSVMRQRRTLGGPPSAAKANLSLPPTDGLMTLSPVSIHKTANIPLENRLTSQGVLKHVFTKQSSNSSSMPSTSQTISTNVTMSSSTGVGGKMKSHRRTAHYTTAHQPDNMQSVTPPLPDVPLPISAALPSFNFGRPGSTSTPAVSKLHGSQPITLFQSKKMESTGPEKPLFNFAEPTPRLQLSPQSSNTPPSSLPQFQFSLPAESTADAKVEGKLDPVNVNKKPAQQNSPEMVGTKRKSVVDQVSFKSPKTLVTTGSVMDILGAKSKPTVTEGSNKKLNPLASKMDKWECESCLLMNTMDKACCVACQSLKPQKKMSTSSSSAGNKWECTVCMLMNKDTDDKCVACESPKVKIPTLLSTKFQSGDKWECPVCMVRNKNDVEKCVACTTARPGNKPDVFAKSSSSGKWECSCCMLRVDADKTSCPACLTPKPGSSISLPSKEFKNTLPQSIIDISKSSSSEKFSFGVKKQQSDTDKWECGVCLLKNKSSSDVCLACQAPRPFLKSSHSDGKQLKQGLNEMDSGKSFSGFAQTNKSKWECNVCLVQNSTDIKKCVACQSTRPGMSTEEKPAQFSFGKTSTSVFKFGTSDKSCLSENTSSSAKASDAKFGSSTLKFGKSSSDNNPSQLTSASEPKKPFSFGIPKQNENKSESTKRTADTLEKKDVSTLSQTSGSSDVQIAGSSHTKTTTKVSSSSTSGNKDGLAFEKKTNLVLQTNTANQSDPNQKPSSTFGFVPLTQSTVGTTASSLPSQKATFQFATAPQAKQQEVKTTSSSLSSTNTFQFGATPQTNSTMKAVGGSSQNQTFQFGAPSQPKPTLAISSASAVPKLPTFGASDPDAATKVNLNDPTKSTSTSSFGFSTAPKQPTFSFGSKKSDVGGNEIKSMFGQPTTTGGTSQKPSGFSFTGTTLKPQQNNDLVPKPFGFSASNQSADTGQSSTSGFQFGSGSKGVLETPAGGFSFSKNPSTSTFQQKPTFQFGAKPEGSSAASFNFGSQQQTQPDSTSGFQFGASTATSNSFAANALSAPQAPAGGSSMFSIGQTNTTNPGRASTPVSGRQIKRATRRVRK